MFSFGLDSIYILYLTVGYWPINYDIELFTFPEPFKKVFEAYNQAFSEKERLKALVMHNNLGNVELELEF
jgi:hypothetical protein